MKILHTADWHIGQFKGPVVDGVNLRSQDTMEVQYLTQMERISARLMALRLCREAFRYLETLFIL